MNNSDPKEANGIFAKFSAFVIIAAALGLIWYFVKAFLGSPAPVQASIIAGMVTIGGSVISIIYNARNQKRREIESEHRKQKAEVYGNFMKLWFDIISRKKIGKEEMTEIEMAVPMLDFNRGVIVWGSDDVLRCFLQFRSLSNGDDNNLRLRFEVFEQLILSMRRDLGHDNNNLTKGDLLRVFINDFDDAMKFNELSKQESTEPFPSP